jgi:hypothetical protein
MDPTRKLKYHMEAEFSKLQGKIMHTMSSCWKFINLITTMDFLICSSDNPKVSGSNLGSNFSRCRGRLCTHPGMDRASLANQG